MTTPHETVTAALTDADAAFNGHRLSLALYEHLATGALEALRINVDLLEVSNVLGNYRNDEITVTEAVNRLYAAFLGTKAG